MTSHVHSAGLPLRRWLVAAALGAVWLNADAQNVTYIADALGRYHLSGSTAAAVPTGTKMPPLAVPTVPGASFAGDTMIFSEGSQPKARYRSSVPVPGSNGRRMPVDATTTIPKPSAASAIGKFARRGLPIAGTFYATVELIKDLGFIPKDEDGDGLIEVIHKPGDPNWCTSSPCYEYRVADAADSVWRRSRQEACDDAVTHRRNATPSWQWSLASISDPAPPGKPYGACHIAYVTDTGQSGTNIADLSGRERTPDVGNPPTVPATWEEFEDEIAQQSGWPTRSTQALAEALKAGESFEAPLPTVSGPASTAGPQETKVEPVTKPGPDGQPLSGQKTTNSQTTYNHTYNTNTVTTTVNVNNTYTYNWSDGTTETENGTEQKEPEKDADACEKDPNRVGCAELDEQDGKVPKETRQLTYAPEVIGGSSYCPADVVRTVQGRTFTVFSYAEGCDLISSYVKPLVLALSAFVAFFILMPGGREVAA